VPEAARPVAVVDPGHRWMTPRESSMGINTGTTCCKQQGRRLTMWQLRRCRRPRGFGRRPSFLPRTRCVGTGPGAAGRPCGCPCLGRGRRRMPRALGDPRPRRCSAIARAAGSRVDVGWFEFKMQRHAWDAQEHPAEGIFRTCQWPKPSLFLAGRGNSWRHRPTVLFQTEKNSFVQVDR
jgi:hypothetical protein